MTQRESWNPKICSHCGTPTLPGDPALREILKTILLRTLRNLQRIQLKGETFYVLKEEVLENLTQMSNNN